MSAPMPKPDELLKHTAFVRAMARSVLGLDDQVEDAVQETMLAALRQPPPAPGRLRAWLGSISRRRALDLRRRDTARTKHERQGARADGAPDVSELAARTEVGRTMAAAVLELDAAHRDPILLRYYEDLPPRVIAERLSVPVETVRTRIRRGLARVRDALERSHKDDPREWRGVLLAWIMPAELAPAAIPIGMILAVGIVLVAGAVGLWQLLDRSESQEREGAPEIGAVPQEAEGAGATLAGRAGPAVDVVSDAEEAGAPPGPAAGTYVVTGYVRDAGGKPVASIPVRYSHEPEAAGVERALSEVWTDSHGRYVLPGLRRGKLWLALLSQPDGQVGREVTLALEADAAHDFIIPDGLVYSGVVDAPGDAPIELYLDYHEEHPGGLSLNRFKVRRVILGADRRFGFTGMLEGAYRLVLSGSGFARMEVSLELRASATDVRLEMTEAVVAKGRVVLDPRLRPGRTTFWIRAKDVPQRMITCDADGAFEITGARPGDYHVFLRAVTESKDDADYTAIYTERNLMLRVGAIGDPLTIDVAPDELVGLRIELPDGASRLEGVVKVHVAGKPKPIAEHAFRAERTEAGGSQTRIPGFSNAYPPRRTKTPSGQRWLTSMPVGTYRLVMQIDGFDEEEQLVEVRGAQDVTFHPRRAVGRIVTSRDYGAYWFLKMRPAGSDGDWTSLLWSDARVRISHRETPGTRRAFLPEGRYEFRLTSRDYAETLFGPVEVRSDNAPLVLDFAPDPGFSISGTVRRGGKLTEALLHVFRKGADGVWVRLEEKEGRSADGAFVLRGMAPGAYRLSTSRSGEPVVGTVDVVAADPTLDLTLPTR